MATPVAIGLLLMLAAACGPASSDSAGGPAMAPPQQVPEVLIPAPDLTGVELRTQDDETVALEELRGKPALLSFIYTRCPMPEMCPATMLRLKEVQQALSAEERGRVRLLTVSFDPFDTPAVLAEFGALWEVDTGFWTLLTGDADSVRRVAGAYGAWYEKAEGEVYDHTMLTMVLLADGSVHQIHTGSAWDSTAVAGTLRALTVGNPSIP